jgi:hypothetical protein
MRKLVIGWCCGAIIISGCSRLKQNQSATSAANRNEPAATPARPAGQAPVSSRPVAVLPGPAHPPSRPPAAPVDRKPRKGTLTVLVYETPLDLQLDALTLHGGQFKLEGFGVRYVGRMSQDWRRHMQKPVALEKHSELFGDSEMDLPMVGVVKVHSGELVIDEIIDVEPARIRGHLRFALPGPDGISTFAGKFEVDLVSR